MVSALAEKLSRIASKNEKIIPSLNMRAILSRE
jgi:hypothetical protein